MFRQSESSETNPHQKMTKQRLISGHVCKKQQKRQKKITEDMQYTAQLGKEKSERN
jgi:hypothetical protein